MEVGAVVERVERIAAARVDAAADRPTRERALVDLRHVRSWLAAAEADLVSSVAEESSFPEQTIAEASKGTLGSAGKTLERAETLDAVPDFASALDDGAITAGHVDAITRAGRGLDVGQRSELHDRVGELVDRAAGDSVDRFGTRVRDLARNIQHSDGIDRLDRQQRSTSLRTWVDNEGMWNLRAKYDPTLAPTLATRLDDTVETLFAEQTPDTTPGDPAEKQAHLRALALARLITGTTTTNGSDGDDRPTAKPVGRPEYVVVIDADQPNGAGEPTATWNIPIEVPWHILAQLSADADVHPVVVRNGIVLSAPGDLNLGRTTRLANRAQRRALRGLYTTCAIPGCATHYDRCKLHHVIWWRHGGRTDLDNLLPLCVHHHHKVHDADWHLTLGTNRELTLTLPDGTIHNTGPPNRHAA